MILNKYVNEWSMWFHNYSFSLTQNEKEKLSSIGLKKGDINFIGHLKYTLVNKNNFSNRLDKYLDGNYNESNRTITNKLFNGHLTLTELMTILSKFK